MTEHLTFDAPASEVFADRESRVIRGLAIPLNATARKAGKAWKFAPDSVTFADRTPLLMFHDTAKPVGRLTGSSWSERGLEVDFQVSKTSAGDEALQLAADQVLALSVGIDVPDGGMKARGDVLDISEAFGREVSLTPTPAFDGASIDSVSLSSDERTPTAMAETTEATPVAVNLDTEALGNSIAQAFSKLPVPQAQAVARLDSVREEAPYRFDAERGRFIGGGAHDFSSDLIAGSRGDGAALERANEFVRLQFDVDTGNVSGMNPTRQRPDLYVDQRAHQYPLWTAVNKGGLSDITPFTFPKFNSSSGLVALHTEGVEPTPGAFTATSQTVTPQAVSGKVEITREVWDQGGNPQVSNLIWQQMVRAFYEALEAKVVSVLDAASPTGITITTAAADGALQAELVSAFSSLQYVRGGFAFDTWATQIDLYKKLAGAVDDAGRPLFPIIGPSNALGTAQARYASMDVAGVRAFPAWALAATGTVAASSYLFDSTSVHAWASTPQRLDISYRVAYVDLGLWGYSAAAISDLSGVREVIYDPAA